MMLARESKRDLRIMRCSLCNALIHDSTPSLGAELLWGLMLIRDVDVEDDDEDEQRQDEIERITWETEMTRTTDGSGEKP